MASSSFSQTVATPRELLAVLSILNEKQKTQHEQQQQEKHQHLCYQHQYSVQQQHKQQQLEQRKWKGEQKQFQQHMELCQIELIYRAEGNANLVLALPQFKKVLRLPKILKQHEQKDIKQKPQCQEAQRYQKNSQQNKQKQDQPKEQDEMKEQESKQCSTTGQQENKIDAAGILTMDHYVAYIGIIRCLVGNEFVFEADAVAVPNPTDRHWINEHIKPYRPANRLDKEFGGQFGLLLPDATQLPAEFDILFSKFQSAMATIATETSHCSNSKGSASSSSGSNTDNSCSVSNNIFGSDTFAIEIKPKQGWLLPNDVNNLFDIKPKITQRTRITRPPSLRETKNALKAAVATTMPTETETKALKTSTDIQCFTTTQNNPSQTIARATTTATRNVGVTASTTSSQAEDGTTGRCYCSDSMSKTSDMMPRDDKISHSLHDNVDTRCRYCCMQFLKLKQQKISKHSQYCPIDLFSGITEKMLFALQALFECPQNNLRIFQNGHLIFDDHKFNTIKIEEVFSSDKLQLIKHLLVTCLLREYEDKEEEKVVEEEEEEGAKKEKLQIDKDISIQQPLSSTIWGVGDDRYGTVIGVGAGVGDGVAAGQPHSSVTSGMEQKLSRMPKTIAKPITNIILTETEVTKVKSTLTSAKPIFSMDNTLMSTSDYNTRCLEEINKAEVTCLPKNCVLQKLLHIQLLAKINLQYMLDHEYADKREKTYNIVCKLLEKFSKANNKLTLCQLSPEEQYILAATALDCSIMITFCEIDNFLEEKKQKPKRSSIDSPFVVSIFGRKFLTKVTILDLDPKPDAHFNKYFLQTKQIFDAMKEL